MNVSIRDFLDYAGENPDRWDQLTGRKVRHGLFGEGVVDQVEIADGEYSIRIVFEKRNQPPDARTFGKQGLFAVESIEFPEALAKKMLDGAGSRSSPRPKEAHNYAK